MNYVSSFVQRVVQEAWTKSYAGFICITASARIEIFMKLGLLQMLSRYRRTTCV